MKNRYELANFFRDKGFKKGVEVGVFDGHYSKVLMDHISDLTLTGVDPYMVYKGYRDHKFDTSMQRAEKLAHERLDHYDKYKFMKMTSEEAAPYFPDESLDFVFIDGNHAHDFVKLDLELWTSKVRTGGIVSGHDYYVTRSNNTGVIRAVNDFVASHNYELHTTDWDETMEMQDDRQPCWYFLKP